MVTRFSSHRRRWDDIEYLDFCMTPRASLLQVEKQMIGSQLSLGKQLRNITHALGPLGDSDLDPVVTPDEQHAWLNDDAFPSDVAERIRDPKHRAEKASKFRMFTKMHSAPFVLYFLNLHVRETIPKPRETERTFWALSAMPSTNGGARLATLSINKMETLFLYGDTVGRTRGDGDVGGVINVSSSMLAQSGGIARMRREFPHVSLEKTRYEAAGGDGLAVRGGVGDLTQLLWEDWFVQACRTLNLTLMRKGPTLQWRWHCFDLADWAVRDDLDADQWISTVDNGILVVPDPAK